MASYAYVIAHVEDLNELLILYKLYPHAFTVS